MPIFWRWYGIATDYVIFTFDTSYIDGCKWDNSPSEIYWRKMLSNRHKNTSAEVLGCCLIDIYSPFFVATVKTFAFLYQLYYYVFLQHNWITVQLLVDFILGKPDPPKDVRIHVIGSTAHISWTIPTNIQGAIWSRISIKSSSGRDVNIGSGRNYKDIRILESSSFEIDTLKICSEYYVKIQFLSPTSEVTTQKFWMTSKLLFP